MIEVIIPTRSSPPALEKLVRQIHATAGYPHKIVYTGLYASAACNRNIGLDRSEGKAIVMVDDDIEFSPESAGWLAIFQEALSRPEVVMVSAQLLNPNGSFAYMTGLDDCGLSPRKDGESVVPSKRLLTACCAFKHHNLRFDEKFIGSGFEDLDFCNSLAAVRPDGIFLVCHRALAVHRNEHKNQQGSYWRANEAYYNRKWRIPQIIPSSI